MKKETSLTSIDDIKGRVLTLRNQPVLLDREKGNVRIRVVHKKV